MRSDLRRWSALAALGALALPACTRTMLERSAADDFGAQPRDFWGEIEQRRVVTNHDAIHGLLLLADGEDPRATYEERLAAAVERGWWPRDATPETFPPNRSARLGDVAVASTRIAEIKGGLTMRVFGPSPRYATRELVYMGMLPDRTAGQSISGLEFIDLVGRVQDHQDRVAGVPAEPEGIAVPEPPAGEAPPAPEPPAEAPPDGSPVPPPEPAPGAQPAQEPAPTPGG